MTSHDSPAEAIRFEHDGIVMDRLRRKVTAGGQPLPLTTREFALLELFLARPGHVLTRDQIASAVWETDEKFETNLIDVYVLRVRKKLAAALPHGRGIRTIRGIDYALE